MHRISGICRYLVILGLVVTMDACDKSTSSFNPNNAWMPIPVKYNGKYIVIECTSGYDRYVHNLIPSRIEQIYWDNKIFIARIHPLVNRNQFQGDPTQIPDMTKSVWFLIDLATDSIYSFNSEPDFHNKVQGVGVDPNKIQWLNLHEAWQQSEKELGFEFTEDAVKKFLQSHPST